MRTILFLLSALLCAGAAAQTPAYPTKPVRFIVPSAAGGGTDIIARAISLRLGEVLGQQFVVDNRPGAGQMIGIELAARSPADGYTILMAASTLAINPIMYKKVPYDPLRDFAPITQAASLPNVLVVHPSLAVKSLAELIAYAKQHPGQLNFASAGIGTSPQMSVELLKSMAGIDMVHVPYKGTAPGVVDLLAGQVLVMAPNVLTALPHIKSGKLRALAVTSAKRSVALPDIPTVAESGLAGYDSTQWYGVLAPAGTPRPVVARLHDEIVRALRDPDVMKRLAADGAEPVGSTPEDFAAFIRSESEKWAKVAAAAHIRAE
ncbi:MAG TPA: tripartite tricarboxylate transporter substrate binding protein [Burkholderiales bacterium]|nr:tripartite tricarboxylate transporter substrate binding protein [Burkholderiales bacterium]